MNVKKHYTLPIILMTGFGFADAGAEQSRLDAPVVVIAKDHTCTLAVDGRVECLGEGPTVVLPEAVQQARFFRLQTGVVHACGVTVEGAILCWGNNGRRQLEVPAAGPYRDVAVGRTHSCGLKEDSTVVCWGANQHGQTKVPTGLNDVHQLLTESNSDHTCAVNQGTRVQCWGRNDVDQAPAENRFLGNDTDSLGGYAEGCWVFVDENYGGESLHLTHGEIVNRLPDHLYDEISSIRVSPGYNLEVSEQPDFKDVWYTAGDGAIFEGEHPDLEWDWDDDIAAVGCYRTHIRPAGGCIVYRHPNWKGGYLTLVSGQSYRIANTSDPFADIKSVRISFGYELTGELFHNNYEAKYNSDQASIEAGFDELRCEW